MAILVKYHHIFPSRACHRPVGDYRTPTSKVAAQCLHQRPIRRQREAVPQDHPVDGTVRRAGSRTTARMVERGRAEGPREGSWGEDGAAGARDGAPVAEGIAKRFDDSSREVADTGKTGVAREPIPTFRRRANFSVFEDMCAHTARSSIIWTRPTARARLNYAMRSRRRGRSDRTWNLPPAASHLEAAPALACGTRSWRALGQSRLPPPRCSPEYARGRSSLAGVYTVRARLRAGFRGEFITTIPGKRNHVPREGHRRSES